MKNTFFAILALFIAATAIAQPNQQGNIEFKTAWGGPNLLGIGINLLPDGVSDQKHFGILTGSFSYFVADNFSIGLYGSYLNAKTDLYELNFDVSDSVSISGLGHVKVSRTMIGIRPQYHFSNGYRVDPYIGGTLGVRYTNINPRAEISAQHGNFTDIDFANQIIEKLTKRGYDLKFAKIPIVLPAASIHFGTKVKFTENFGIYGELGLGATPLANIGISAKF